MTGMNYFHKKAITLDLEAIGSVLFEKSKRAKHLNISIRPFKGIRVAVPQMMSYAQAEEIVRRKIPWIRKHAQRMKNIEIEREKTLKDSGTLDKEKVRRILISRLSELSRKYGFSYNKVFIKNQKTRWGSCSARNNINLNIKLILLPGELMDYVLLHELVHTKIKNHSKRFWDELNRFVPNARSLNRQLRKSGVGL